ncbi:VCBS repeat-containing protein [Streptomyces sp. NPDC006458]|uniref:FG-GAP repeat domain-containing protein n=1 Tax=Streptomyces sp. NPDC006458 TaxID=3154302 RepID=UPI00339F673C
MGVRPQRHVHVKLMASPRRLGTGVDRVVRIAANWSGCKEIVGVGDITGDGKSDILSRDTSGNLWRNNGTGSGTFGPRAKIASGRPVCKGVF